MLDDCIVVKDSKTPAGRRRIPLSKLCKEELQRWARCYRSTVSPYVFPNPRNPARHLGGFEKTWKRALKAAGIPYFPPYNLRHTFATRLNAAGATDLTIAQMMGHSTPSILQTYAKAVDSIRRDAIRRAFRFAPTRCYWAVKRPGNDDNVLASGGCPCCLIAPDRIPLTNLGLPCRRDFPQTQDLRRGREKRLFAISALQ